jgi:hypothetical protein
MSSLGSLSEAMGSMSIRHTSRLEQEATTNLQNLMADLGDVRDDGNGVFVVCKTEPGLPDDQCLASAGVKVKTVGGQIKVKVMLEEEDIGGLYSNRHAFMSTRAHGKITLRIPRKNSRCFYVSVRKFRNAQGVKMVAYEPGEALDEEVMRKCVSLVAAAFNH